MFIYQKKLQYPVKIKNTNPKLAAQIISQYGGPDGELGASMRYLSQRYSMPYPKVQALLTDIGTSVTVLHPSEPLISLGFSSNLRYSKRGYREDGEITNPPLYLAGKTRELL